METNQTKQAKHDAKKRSEMKELGKVERRVWVYPECSQKLRDSADCINKQYEKTLNK